MESLGEGGKVRGREREKEVELSFVCSCLFDNRMLLNRKVQHGGEGGVAK